MKKTLLITLIILSGLSSLKAQTYDTLATFIVPNHLALGVTLDYVNNYYIISSGGQSNATPNDNVFLRYDMNGVLVDSFPEPFTAATSGFGIRDLAFDGTFIYGSFDAQVQQFDNSALSVVNVFPGLNNPNRGMAVDTDLTVYSTNFDAGPIAHFTSAGAYIDSCSRTTITGSAPYGIAVDNWTQPGTKRLWMNTPSLTGAGLHLTLYNFDNCTIENDIDLTALIPPYADPAVTVSGGLDIVNNHPNYPGKIVGIMLGQDNPTAFVMLIDMTPPVLVFNDSCVTSIDLTSSIGQPVGVTQTTGPYDNDSASTGNDDPATGFGCFGEPDGTGSAPTLDNTLWFSFVGDGGLYFIETGNCAGVTNYIDDGDTQIAIYDGTCGALNPLACNEDGPNATTTTYPAGLNFQTTAGTTYYMLIDGFNFNGALSTGEFCVNITQLSSVACGAPGITVGVETQSTDTLCFNDTLTVTVTGTVAPTVGQYSGLSWLISTADLAGTPDPLNDPSVQATYTIQNPAPPTSFRLYINNATGILTPGITYYWTPVVFANATAATPPTFLSDLTLDITCTYTGASLPVYVAAQGDPACTVGINENNGVSSDLGITNLYPVPVKDKVTFTLNSKDQGMVTISLKDQLGKEVFSTQLKAIAGANTVTLDLSSQSAGVYFISAGSDAGTVVSKFVKE